MSDLASTQARIHRVRRTLDEQRGENHALLTTLATVTTDITNLRADITVYERAAHVLASIGEHRQSQAQHQIETLVTHGLHTIFDTNLSFHLVAGTRAKTPVVDFVVRTTMTDGPHIDTDVMDARGGGLAATVGFLLRLVILLLNPHRSGTVIFLDETFAHVSAEYEHRLAEFLRELTRTFDVQIVLVTHSDAFLDAADVTYRLTQHDGVTQARAV